MASFRILFICSLHRSAYSLTLSSVAVNPAFPFPHHFTVTDVTGGRSSDVFCMLLKYWTAVQLN
jgi:hypothetical protein